ncbi:GNAT family N-acetyltransferase [Cellulophaga sp. 20_2_10]|uniref:GNAT family N-acetyltransferase n=1 Tax=Cellulophaga sp. 20_2_10 TaxID=2942476 RepID=UPI00201AB763|nr:GNAT family N-acetyltransferase [Cellulophaga sp. 20_2_10]MCL5244804.1 GNAT family N-acetyltransferase [Cellulophaga sp. 20_2_10]
MRHIDFFDLLLVSKDFAFYFKKIKSKVSKNVLYTNTEPSLYKPSKEVYKIVDIPDYMEVELHNSSTKLKSIDINTYKGSMVNLTKYSNLKEFLTKHFNAKKRAQFNTYKKRLEKCFNISYKVYFGNIEKAEYDRLFKKFPEMIKKRFDLLGTEHYDLAVWDRYEQNSFSLINEKRACLFVIYDGNNPISISLTPVMGKVLYGFVRGFDVNYSKFYLGFTDLIFQLEWCFNNNMEVFDLVKGVFPYKSKFTNSTYYFQNKIIYNTTSVSSTCIALAKSLKIKSFYFIVKLLKKINIDTLYHSYINKKNDEKKIEKLSLNNECMLYKTTILTSDFIVSKNHNTIDIRKSENSFLRKTVYDILYTLQEPITSITIYKETEERYILKGIKKSYKITATKAL